MRIKITDFGTAKLLQKEELVDGKPADGAFTPSFPSPLTCYRESALMFVRVDAQTRKDALDLEASSVRPSMSVRRS